jgi:glycosyltransferase involved in cell wall biosynthesis
MKVLALATNGLGEASTRYRFTQFAAALAERGHRATVSAFYPELPRAGRSRTAKLRSWATGFARQSEALTAAPRYDAVFVQRSIFPAIFPALSGSRLVRAPMVYDFDDALWLFDRGACARFCRRADRVIAGNAFLADFARRHSDRVSVVPTVVDTDRFRPVPHTGTPPLVGWIGSPSTFPYLAPLLPALDALGQRRRFRLRIVGAPEPVRLQHVEVEQPPWSADSEPRLFAELDVGLYPLRDDVWSRGKCGLKSIQYMSCGVPHVASPVGVVPEIGDDGRTALFARDPRAFCDQVVRLLDDATLRERMISSGRARIVEAYSLQAWSRKWVALLEDAA